MWAALSPLVLWLAAIAAYAYEDGMNLFQWMGRFSQVLERPFSIGWTPYTLKYMLGSLLLYGCGVALYYSSRENRRPGEEYGSAKWGNPKELNRKYMDHQHAGTYIFSYKNKIRYKKHLGTGRVYVDLRQQIVEINFSSPEKCNIREITYTLR